MGTSNSTQRLLRRSKDSERRLGRFLMEHDGADPLLAPGGGIVSKTGRVGHITALQYDVHSRSYAAENKNVRLTTQLLKWWTQIFVRALDQRKQPLLVIDPSNKPNTFVHNGFTHKIPVMHIITEDRHAELLRCERIVEGLESPIGKEGVV